MCSRPDPIQPTRKICQLTPIVCIQEDDELEAPYLAGFEWDREECYTKFIVHQKKTGDAPSGGSSKKKNKKGEDGS